MFHWFRNRRRRKLLAEPFPDWWNAILERNVKHYSALLPNERARVQNVVRVIVAEKIWEGCGGLHITEEIKLTVAASAALLLIGLENQYFERVQSIIVYPDTFRTPQEQDDWEDDELSDVIVEGQAVYRGPVILSWSKVLHEGRFPEEGFNVVLHEFAHQLDFLSNTIDGTPPLNDAQLEARWRTVMQDAYQRHLQDYEKGRELFFTEHAAESETEFFADATEAFYCRPHDLLDVEPEVYELLMSYFRVDPRVWF